MLGAASVGKTSLVRRFVESIFSEKYQATIGVKIDRKLVELDGAQVSLLLWDFQGEDEFRRQRTLGRSRRAHVGQDRRPRGRCVPPSRAPNAQRVDLRHLALRPRLRQRQRAATLYRTFAWSRRCPLPCFHAMK